MKLLLTTARARYVPFCSSVGEISILALLFCGLLFASAMQSVAQNKDDYQTFALCAGYISRELKANESSKSSDSVAALRAESAWFKDKLVSLPMRSLEKTVAVDLGTQTYDLDVERSGGPPTEQLWRARRHTECAEIAVKLFAEGAKCFERREEDSLFVCNPPDSALTSRAGVMGNLTPGTAAPPDAEHSSPSFGKGSPSAVYKEFLRLRDKRQCSKMFDMLDPDSQRRFAADMAQFVAGMAPETAGQVSSLSDRDIYIMVCKTGPIYEIKILSEHITGDVAILGTKILVNNEWCDPDYPPELHKINGKWFMYWPR